MKQILQSTVRSYDARIRQIEAQLKANEAQKERLEKDLKELRGARGATVKSFPDSEPPQAQPPKAGAVGLSRAGGATPAKTPGR